MNKVAIFKYKKRDHIDDDTKRSLWSCDCENVTFYMFEDGEVKCAKCETPQPNLRWFFLNEVA